MSTPRHASDHFSQAKRRHADTAQLMASPPQVWSPSTPGGCASSITVGMPVTQHPLHRSGREVLPHPAPTLGLTANVPWTTEGDPTTSSPYTRQRLGHARPALRPVRVTCRLFPLVTALPSTRSAARRGALFAGFCGTMLVSDCSGPCITGVEIGSSRCGPPNHRVASPELSQFPCKECTRFCRKLPKTGKLRLASH